MINSKDSKDIAIIFPKENSGCSHVRLRYNAEFINSNDFGVTPLIMPPLKLTFDPYLLTPAKSLIFQRPECLNDYVLFYIIRNCSQNMVMKWLQNMMI